MAAQPAPAKGWQESPLSFPHQEHHLRDFKGQCDFANERAGSYANEDGSGQQLIHRMGVASGGRQKGLERVATLGLGRLHDRLLLSINGVRDLRDRFPRTSKAAMVTLSAIALLVTWNFLMLLRPVQAVPRPLVATFLNSTTTNITTHEALSSTYWVSAIQRQGTVPFGSGSFTIFRNVKTDFHAVGDGVTDDTAAINNAISAGGRCGQGCDSSTTTPAIIYFPPGTYLISAPIIQYYYTQLVGDALSIPVLKASAGFQGIAVIDADPYAAGGVNWYTNQNNFFRQVRNFVIDVTAQPASTGTGIHWQVAQATSLQNIRFEMLPGSNQQGIFMDNGSGGFMTDLTFNGGNYGAFLGNQQFTTRNLVFNGCKTAIFMNWNWAWTFKSLNINNCGVGIDMSSGGSSQTVGSVLILDSKMTNTPKAVVTSYSGSSTPETGGTLVLDNVDFTGSSVAVARPDGSTVLAGGSVVSSWGQGNMYTPTGSSLSSYSKTRVQGPQTGPTKPGVLLNGGSVFERSRPQYETIPASSFVSVKSAGAKGDGSTDDSNAIQSVFNNAQPGQIVYFDHGAYIVTKTIKVPKNIKITGEIWPLIMASGPNFQDQTKPIPVFQVGQPGDVGSVEMSDLIFETAGPCPGAILMEWNVAQSSQGATGLWDVHFRIGGTAGTQLQSNTCAKNPSVIAPADPHCEGAFLLMHITTSGSCYLENVWFWVADHELDLSDHSQINVYNGRGLLIESQGPVWMYGTASEHSQLYNYQFANAKNIWVGLAQTETPYYQSNPNALSPFTPNPSYNDPDFSACTTDSCRKAWGLRVLKSQNVLLYGAGFYSFFDNYSQNCLATESCQVNMVSVEQSSNTWLYGLSTKASTNMVMLDGSPVVLQADNRDNFCSTIELFKQN